MLELTMRDDERTRILKRFGEAGQRSRVQKMERLAASALVDLEEPDEDASFGQKAAYTAANLGIGLVGAAIGGGIGAGVGGTLNQQLIKRGKNELARQLTSQEYRDIKMGRIKRKALMEINDVRLREGVEPMRDNMLTIPKSQVEHIYEGRVKHDGSSPWDIAESVERIISSKKPIVARGNKPNSQEIANIRDGSKSADVAYASVFKEKDYGIFSRYLGMGEKSGIVTTMKKNKKRLGR